MAEFDEQKHAPAILEIVSEQEEDGYVWEQVLFFDDAGTLLRKDGLEFEEGFDPDDQQLCGQVLQSPKPEGATWWAITRAGSKQGPGRLLIVDGSDVSVNDVEEQGFKVLPFGFIEGEDGKLIKAS